MPDSQVSPQMAREAVAALVSFYNHRTGLWRTTGWWNSANALTAVIDYTLVTGDHAFDDLISTTYKKNLGWRRFLLRHRKFTNAYIDDTGWWALAWLRAYDLTAEQRYLEIAQYDVDYMWSHRTETFGGGVTWKTDSSYKNAVTNALMIKAAAALHNRCRDQKYLPIATETWDWLLSSGMINSENLINDGLNDHGENNGQTTWTYNQGIILGAAVELARATDDQHYLEHAQRLADASTTSPAIMVDGVLTEPHESDSDCGADAPTFKGVYVRNLGELNAALPDRPYQAFLEHQAKIIYAKNRTSDGKYGLHWAGPIAAITAATQQSAVEALVAPLRH